MSSTPQPPPFPGQASMQPYAPPPGRSVSFFVAIFLAFLLLISGALNVLLLVASIGSFATSGLTAAGDDDGAYQMVHVAGDRNAETKVLRIAIQGAISEGQNPILGASGGTVTQVRRALRAAARDDSIRGVLLAIDSPGGGVTDSDEIYQMIVRFRNEHSNKRVLALFGDIAASGGYYVAAAAEHIMARRTSITGSIGVVMSAWNFTEAADKLGIDQVVIKSQHTPFKDILSPTRPMTDDERRMLTGIVEELYQQFVDVVDQGRPSLDHAQVQALATGAIYSAKQALQNGLIDQVGSAEDAVAWFDKAIGSSVDVLDYRRAPSLRDLLFGAQGPAPATMQQAAAQLLTGTTGPRLLYFWQGGR